MFFVSKTQNIFSGIYPVVTEMQGLLQLVDFTFFEVDIYVLIQEWRKCANFNDDYV